MKGLAGVAVVLILAAAFTTNAAAEDHSWMVVVKGNLTSGSKLFPNPNASDPIARGQSYDFSDFFGAGLEVRYRLPGTSVAFGLSTDYLSSEDGRTLPASGQRFVPVTDGFTLIPVELTGYFYIPITTGPLNVFMGWGAGFYYGERRYSIAGVEAPLLSTTPGFGIHVLGGIIYTINGLIALSFEMKFRDAQFEATNKFSVSRISYRDAVISVSQAPFQSRLHSDGMTLQLGASIAF